LVAAGFVVL